MLGLVDTLDCSANHEGLGRLQRRLEEGAHRRSTSLIGIISAFVVITFLLAFVRGLGAYVIFRRKLMRSVVLELRTMPQNQSSSSNQLRQQAAHP